MFREVEGDTVGLGERIRGGRREIVPPSQDPIERIGREAVGLKSYRGRFRVIAATHYLMWDRPLDQMQVKRRLRG